MSQKRLVVLLVLAALLFGVGTSRPASAADKVKLTWITHWNTEAQIKAEQALIDEYQSTHPDVTIVLQAVDFGDLLTKITTSNTAGTNADIYHVYNLWLPDFAKSKLLAIPPDDMIAAIKKNAAPAAVAGITVNGQIWGYPTELNTYLLNYNKKLLKEAGFDKPPATWDELKAMAPKITKKDSTGAIKQVGYAVIPGWDSGMVHPFSALLFSNGGDYLSADGKTVAFNSPQGVATLQLYMDLLKSGGMDVSINGMNDFPNGKVGMTIMANWWRSTLETSKNIDFKNDVGVAPIPVGPSGKASTTLSYNWLLGVDAKSAHPKEAWEFVRWLTSPRGEGKGSPMGDYLTSVLGAIPSSLFDQKAYNDRLNDFFLTPYIASTTNARPEPVIAGGQEIKTKLQTQLEAVLNGQGEPKAALDQTASEANDILSENQSK